MISKKENLLTRPWQQRKFDHHRQKVQSALPAIDTRPPPYRSHVSIKLKKQQKELERCRKIEKDNYLLLQKLNNITRTSRVDNTWTSPQPTFLNRVPIYNSAVPRIEDLINLDFELTDDDCDEDIKEKKRKSKCYACTPQKKEELKIPEERVPWEPQKAPAMNRVRSKSVPARKSELLAAIKEQPVSKSKPSSSKISDKMMTNTVQQLKVKAVGKKFSVKEPQSIILSRGCLKLSVNFPSDTMVKFQEGNVEKFLMRGVCHCKLSPTEVF